MQDNKFNFSICTNKINKQAIWETRFTLFSRLGSLVLAGITLTTLKNLVNFLKAMEIARLLITVMVLIGWIDGRNSISWIILLTTPLCIWLYPENPKIRIVGVVYGFLCPFALLSASYEPLFYLILAAHLLAWPTPTGSSKQQDTSLTSNDILKAAFFVSFFQLATRNNFRITKEFLTRFIDRCCTRCCAFSGLATWQV